MSTAAKPVGLHDDLWSSHTAMPADLAVLDLPDGELFSGDHGEVLGYRIADKTEPLCGLWLRCAKQFPSTGLWPILSRTSYQWESVSFGERHWTQHYWRAPHTAQREAPSTPGVSPTDSGTTRAGRPTTNGKHSVTPSGGNPTGKRPSPHRSPNMHSGS